MRRAMLVDATDVTAMVIRIIVLLAFCLDLSLAIADDVPDYHRSVKSVLQERCYACHGALKQEGGLRLDTVASMTAGGDSGPSIVASDSDASLLMQRVRHPDVGSRMPPEGQPLTEAQIQQIASWIQTGALAPADDQPQPDPLRHWAFQPPRRPELPPISREFNSQELPQEVNNPIDRLLAVKHQQAGVQPLPSGDYQTLVRRLYFDLIGLPPSPQQLNTALSDPSPNAYERLVDYLLAQSQYGERWGRHWMDVWRYSDWYGRRSVPDVMNSYPQIWRWRDWIVRSLNEDKGYDQMILQMLAADELLPYDDQNVVATGFLVRNWYKWNYETWMKDNVEHTGKAFLGLTLNCAHCHDHKYDPITQEDYFRFRAFFEPLELRHDRVAGQADPGPFKKYVYAQSYGPITTGAIRVFDEKLDAATHLYQGGDSRNRVQGSEPIEPGPPVVFTGSNFAVEPVALPPEAYYPGLKEFVRAEEREKARSLVESARAAYEQAQQAVTTTATQLGDLLAQASQPLSAGSRPSEQSLEQSEQAQLVARLDWKIAQAGLSVALAQQAALESRIAADDARYRGLGDVDSLSKRAYQAEKQVAFETALQAEATAERAVVVASQKAVAAVADKQADAKQTEAKAQEALQAARAASDNARVALLSAGTSYTPLSTVYPTSSTGRRVALARWITDRQNPLTARVAANHLWLRHFGQALVDTTDNLGVQGQKPLHPEILDWLAVELMDNNWSMKHIHRIIVTSQAYRRSSNPPPEHANFAIDRDNHYYWRKIPQRMQAEAVRDSVLACSGALDQTLGGPEIDHAQWVNSPRRSIYFTIHGEAKMQFLDIFDGPNVCECYRRTSTVMPQQALALTNSPLLVHYGRMLAARIEREHKEGGSDTELTDDAFIATLFGIVLSRSPTQEETDIALEFLDKQRQIFQQVLSEQSTQQTTQQPGHELIPIATEPVHRARQNLAVGLFGHNDFVMVR